MVTRRLIGSIVSGIAIGLVGLTALLGSVHDPTWFKTLLFRVALPFVALLMSQMTKDSAWPDWLFWLTAGASVTLWSAVIHFFQNREQR